VLALLALATVAWLALLLVAPVLPATIGAALYLLGSHICHQRPERSFHLFAAQLPVCARCLGIYAGAAAGSLLAPGARLHARRLTRTLRFVLIAGAVPTLITVVLEWSGAWAAANVVRAAAGVPLGLTAALVVAQGVATLHYVGCASRRPISNNRPPTPI